MDKPDNLKPQTNNQHNYPMKTKTKSKDRAAKKQRDNLPPLPHEEVVLNERGHCDEIPRGLIQTMAPKASLERTGIQRVEVDIGPKIDTNPVRTYHPNSAPVNDQMIPRFEDVEINKYDNCGKLPNGWITTDAPDYMLKKIGVQSLKTVVGWGQIKQPNNRSFPILANCYHPDDDDKVRSAEASGEIIPTFGDVLSKEGKWCPIPYRWVETKLTISQLKKIGVKFVKAYKEDPTRGRVQVNCHHPKDLEVVAAYKPQKRKSYQKRAVEKYAEYMTDDLDLQNKIIYEYENNRETKGTAWKQLSSGYKNKDKESMWDAYKMMRAASRRHNHSNYDASLKSGVDRETARATRTNYPIR